MINYGLIFKPLTLFSFPILIFQKLFYKKTISNSRSLKEEGMSIITDK